MPLRADAPAERARGRDTHRPERGGRFRGQWQAPLVGLLLGGGLVYGYVTYMRSGDVAPDSPYGYIFAIAATVLLVLVGVGYTLRKRWRRRRFGLLHTALSWHVVGGVLALALILAHAAGNFHPRTGTYALCSLIALVTTGVIGRQLDRIAPRLAARYALKTLTSDGEERLDALVSALNERRAARRERRQAATQQSAPGAPWDLAYYDLRATDDQIPALLSQNARSKAQVESGASGASGAWAAGPSDLRRAIGFERLCLDLIRVWRYLHTALSVLTLVLILWHLEFAVTLLLNAR